MLMNPPFHDAARQNVSPDPRRRLAHAAAPDLLRALDRAARAWLLKPRGVLTLIWRADGLAEVLAALAARLRRIAVLPVHAARRSAGDPRAGARGQRRARAPLRSARPDAQRCARAEPTAAEAVLRGGEVTLPMASGLGIRLDFAPLRTNCANAG